MVIYRLGDRFIPLGVTVSSPWGVTVSSLISSLSTPPKAVLSASAHSPAGGRVFRREGVGDTADAPDKI